MIHLDIKSDYSFLKAYGNPEQIIERVKATGETSFGIADIASTWGHIPFSKAAKKAGCKVILGVQLPVVPELETKSARHDLVTLLARDAAGLEEQYEALSLATRQFYYRPRLTWEQVANLKGNVRIINRITPATEKHLSTMQGMWFLGAAPSPSYTLSLARSARHPVVAAASPAYPEPRYKEAYQLAVSVGTARKTQEVEAPDAWIFRRGELNSKFMEIGIGKDEVNRWLNATQEIADGCNATVPEAQNIKPGLPITVEEWCSKGAATRGVDLSVEPYKSRLIYELGLIKQKGFEDYFLLIADLIAWAKDRMFVGPARGSSAGSLVCYLMGIVEVNPLTYGLMFERFIDVTRTDLPDVDIDFPDERRDEVFTYLADKYGPERVARLGTVSLFKARSALNDVAKSYSIPKWEVEKLTDVLIERSGGDARANMTIEDTINQFDVGKQLLEKFPDLKMAAVLEGHVRHTGKHAAGVVIANDAIRRYCAIDHYKGGVAQISKYDAESIGLMKIDALGLKTLSVIQDCCDMAGMDPRDLYTYPIDDQKAFDIFQRDKVAGIFQFEGYAVRSLMRQMGVENFNDIVALTSLARPGPLHCGGANEFIVRRTGSKDWDYIHPSLHPHTVHTYGTIVYQEQVMSITRDLGDMDWMDVNALRRAMSKSLGEEFFNKYRDKFFVGTRRKNIPDSIALEIWNEMCTFGSWAFNLSHAVSYATISYWCAVLKHKFPLEFAVAHLRRAASDDHVFRLLRELDKEGYEIVPFDLEHSDINWSTKNGKIYGGFTAVHGIGEITGAKLIGARSKNRDGWIEELTPAMRKKLLAPNNTKWHNLKRLHNTYGDIYDALSRPGIYVCERFKDRLPNGIAGPVINIEDIPEKAGTYKFIATLKVRNLRDLNETQSLVKRGGEIIHDNNLFLNLQFEDDSGSILCSINRFKYQSLGKPLMEEESDEHDFLIKGRIMEDGRRKIAIDGLVRLTDVLKDET